MFGMGMWEIALVFVVALIVLGPQKLPELARQLGQSLREFRRAAHQLRVSLEDTPPKTPAVIRPASHLVEEEAQEPIPAGEEDDAFHLDDRPDELDKGEARPQTQAIKDGDAMAPADELHKQ